MPAAGAERGSRLSVQNGSSQCSERGSPVGLETRGGQAGRVPVRCERDRLLLSRGTEGVPGEGAAREEARRGSPC